MVGALLDLQTYTELHSLPFAPSRCTPVGMNQGFIPICGYNVSSCHGELGSLSNTKRLPYGTRPPSNQWK